MLSRFVIVRLIGELSELDLSRRTGHVDCDEFSHRIEVTFPPEIISEMKGAFSVGTPVVFAGSWIEQDVLFDIWGILPEKA